MINKEELQKKVHVIGQDINAGQVVQLLSIDSNDDEISLIDLYLVLLKRRAALLLVILAFVALGVFFALTKPTTYIYNAVLQIGVMEVGTNADNEIRYIESPANVLEKLTKSYIPLALTEYLELHPTVLSAPKVIAKMAKKSDLITIEMKGIEKKSADYRGIIQNIIGYIEKDHQPQIDQIRGQYERSLVKAKMSLAMLENPLTLKLKKRKLEVDLMQTTMTMANLQDSRLIRVAKQQLLTQKKQHNNKLASLGDEYKRLSSELNRFNDVDVLLKKRIADLSESISDELEHRKLTVTDIKTASEAMTLLLLDNQIQTNRNLLAGLEERLDIKQQGLRESLDNKLKANFRSKGYHQQLILDINNKLQKMDINNVQAQKKTGVKHSGLELSMEKMLLSHKNAIIFQKQTINAITYKLNALKGTQSLTKPIQSLQPVGLSKTIIVAVALLAGLFMGVFVVFFLEFLSKVKDKKQLQ